jgi:hypothetical protein
MSEQTLWIITSINLTLIVVIQILKWYIKQR